MLKRILKKVSNLIARRPQLGLSVQRWVLRAVWLILDLEAATWVVRRFNWLRAGPSPSPLALAVSLPQPWLDPATAARIRSAYAGPMQASRPGEDDIWGSLRNSHLAIVPAAMARADDEALRELSANLFRTSAVNGFSYGSTFDRWPHRWNYLPLMIELSAVNLAECLGVVRLENPEQGAIAGWRQQMSPTALIEALEAKLGFRIEHPRVGNPRGIEFGGRFLARETCSQIYTAHRIAQAIAREGLREPFNLVEIGGGYGGLAYWMRAMFGPRIAGHAIVDLAEVGAIQAMFLSQSDPEGVTMPGEAPRAGAVQLVLNTRMNELGFSPDVVVNQDSMPEMPQSVANDYLRWMAGSGAKLFASFNHEAPAPNSRSELQGWVSQMAAAHPAFERLSRELSWDRPGYLEEIYRIDRPAREARIAGDDD